MNAALATPEHAATPNQDELFSRPGWWDEGNRDYASLRAVNELRLTYLRRWTRDWFGGRVPRTAIDLGCGGGLLSVPLARTGTFVIGVDRCRTGLAEANARGERTARFVQADLSDLPLQPGCADLVLLADVLEHVAEPSALIARAASLLRPGGALFVNTINRTLRARVLAVWLGEGLGLIPRGTHDPRRFVRPDEVAAFAAANGLRPTHLGGERPHLLASLRRRVAVVGEGRSTAVGYCMGFQKMAAGQKEPT